MEQYEEAFYKRLLGNMYVYHYTTIEALFSILEEYRNNGCSALPFRAYCIYKMNDLREMQLGYETVKRLLPQYENNHPNSMNLSAVYEDIEFEKKLVERSIQKTTGNKKEMIDVPFAISFSCKRDFLPMWSMYGDGKKGVCLKFRLSTLVNEMKGCLQLCFVYYKGERNNIIKDFLLPLLYDFDARKYSAGISLDEKINELCLLYECINPFVKSKDWSYESEFRIVFHEHYGPKLNEDFFESLSRTYNEPKLVDYITTPIAANSMEEIIIGPLANYKIVEHMLRNELKECLLNNITVSPSSIKINK